MQFMARAAIHGFTVSNPWGDSARYDFILEHDGGLCRVQVKSTSFCSHRRNAQGYACNVVSRNKIQPATRYSRNDIDFLAAYVIPADAWYIVPIAAIVDRTHAIYLNPSAWAANTAATAKPGTCSAAPDASRKSTPAPPNPAKTA
jgi:hypothetical protein